MSTRPRILARISVGILGALIAATLSLAGCGARESTLQPCALDPDNAAKFTCGNVAYVILDDTASPDDAGAWVGRLHVNAAVDANGRVVAQQSLVDTLLLNMEKLADAAPDAVGIVSYANVYEPKNAATPDELPRPVLIVDVDGVQHRAIRSDRVTSGDRLFDPAAAAATSQRTPSSFAIDPENATRLVADGTLYRVGDEAVAEGELGAYVGIVAASVTYDAETLRPLSDEELAAIDWTGESSDEQRKTRFYGEVRALKDTDLSDALAVEVDGAWFAARTH